MVQHNIMYYDAIVCYTVPYHTIIQYIPTKSITIYYQIWTYVFQDSTINTISHSPDGYLIWCNIGELKIRIGF